MLHVVRRRLTAAAPYRMPRLRRLAFVAVECEMERLQKEYPATAERWIDEVQERAHDPAKDMKAMRRFDDAMGGHVFGGCSEDRKRYPATP
ncbi:hypothetical protein BH11GEM1_BH11GEM1_20350 [soil metagenome]